MNRGMPRAIVAVVLAIVVAASGCQVVQTSSGANPSPAGASTAHVMGRQTKTSGCQARGALPDPDCTPGAVFASATREQICQAGYSKSVRDVPESLKSEVYAEYGIESHRAGQYEVDHLVSLELGGSNEIANLWPEPADPRPGFHEKDQVENNLHDQVCSGSVTLQAAQEQISTDWLALYQRMPGRG